MNLQGDDDDDDDDDDDQTFSDRHKYEPPGLLQGNSKTLPNCLWPVK